MNQILSKSKQREDISKSRHIQHGGVTDLMMRFMKIVPSMGRPSLHTKKESSMKKSSLALLSALTLGSIMAAPVMAQSAGDILVRGRIERLKMDDKSDAFGAVPADAVTLNSKTIPEIDFTYFFTPNFAAELVLTIPQSQDVRLSGTKIGSLKHLPPSLLAQYHFTTGTPFRPYVGAGLNYTRIWGVDLPTGLSLDNSSLGLVVGAGFDYQIAPKWYLNVDVKKISLSSDLKSGGSKISTVKLDPWLFGVGVGYMF